MPDVASGRRGLVAREGLGRAAFLVRIAALTGAFDSEQGGRRSWIGAVIADDVRTSPGTSDPGPGSRPGLGRGPTAATVALRGLAPRPGSGPGRSSSTPLADDGEDGFGREQLCDRRRHREKLSSRTTPEGSRPYWLKRLHDQTTWPRMILGPGCRVISIGISGYSRVGWFGRRIMCLPLRSSQRMIGTPSGAAATIRP